MKNIKNTLWSGLRWLLQRTVMLYLLTVLVSLPFAHYFDALSRARGLTVSRLMPSSDYLIQFRDQRVPLDTQRLQEYYDYYRQIYNYSTHSPDILTLLGYCAYYTGRPNDAIQYYNKVLAKFPGNFSCRYNLGAIYFEQKKYAEALSCLLLATQTNPFKNIAVLPHSRIYAPLIKNTATVSDDLAAYFKRGFERCYRLIILSSQQLKDPEKTLIFSQQAIVQEFNDPAFFYFYAGLASYQLGEYQQSLNLLSSSLALNPKNTAAQSQLGLSLKAIGQKELGAQIYQKAEEMKSQQKDKPEEIILQLY